MSIKEVSNKSKPEEALPKEEEFEIVPLDEKHENKANYKHHLINAVLLILVATISFAVGKLVSSHSSQSVSVKSEEEVITPQKSGGVKGNSVATVSESIEIIKKPEKNTPKAERGGVPIVASKNGTKYYSLGCSGAKRIKEENKIFFASVTEAQKAGLSPSSTCKDLK